MKNEKIGFQVSPEAPGQNGNMVEYLQNPWRADVYRVNFYRWADGSPVHTVTYQRSAVVPDDVFRQQVADASHQLAARLARSQP